MKKFTITLLISLLLFTIAIAQVYQVKQLYVDPDCSVPSFSIPEFIQVYVMEINSQSIRVKIVWDLWILVKQFKGEMEGYLPLKKVIPDGKISYMPLIKQYSSWLGIPKELPMAIQLRETGFLTHDRRSTAISPAGAIGVMQIMPFHAKNFGYTPKDLLDPKVNIEVSCKLIKWLYIRYDKDIEMVLAGYNGGHGQARLPQEQRCNETRNYVKRGLVSYHWLRRNT